MKLEERRKEIAKYLISVQKPVTGGSLAERFQVSRQIIVQDISVLKATGYEIISTHYGYVMQKNPFMERVFKVKHTSDETEKELNCIVELGGAVVDVFVWHKVYGKISANLNIFSKYQVRKFMDGVRTGKSTELMHVTGGYHYHTVRAENKEILDAIESVLKERNFIVSGD